VLIHQFSLWIFVFHNLCFCDLRLLVAKTKSVLLFSLPKFNIKSCIVLVQVRCTILLQHKPGFQKCIVDSCSKGDSQTTYLCKAMLTHLFSNTLLQFSQSATRHVWKKHDCAKTSQPETPEQR